MRSTLKTRSGLRLTDWKFGGLVSGRRRSRIGAAATQPPLGERQRATRLAGSEFRQRSRLKARPVAPQCRDVMIAARSTTAEERYG